MNRPTKNQTKAIVYSCCWQSVSVRMCVGNGCILRRVGKCGVSVGFEQRGKWGYGSHTSSGKILLPTIGYTHLYPIQNDYKLSTSNPTNTPETTIHFLFSFRSFLKRV